MPGELHLHPHQGSPGGLRPKGHLTRLSPLNRLLELVDNKPQKLHALKARQNLQMRLLHLLMVVILTHLHPLNPIPTAYLLKGDAGDARIRQNKPLLHVVVDLRQAIPLILTNEGVPGHTGALSYLGVYYELFEVFEE